MLGSGRTTLIDPSYCLKYPTWNNEIAINETYTVLDIILGYSLENVKYRGQNFRYSLQRGNYNGSG